MNGAPVTWVLCGDAAHPSAPPDALKITLGDRPASITVNIDGFTDLLVGRLSAEFADLLRIAAFVFGADGAVGRGRETDADDQRWCRHFRFIIDVANPDFWNREDVSAALEEVLGFVSQDLFEFQFLPMSAKRPHGAQQLTFAKPGQTFLPWGHIDDVAMFSGGLDSFCGAADLILAQRRSVMLISHRSATKVWHGQVDLAQRLQKLAGTEGCPSPTHVALELVRHDGRLRAERTQRTRSFLYASMAGAVAHLIGHDRVLMYENGIIAINLPLAGSVVGARATRTAHPRTLDGFGRILSLVANRQLQVDNPFALRTRAEIIADLASSPGLPLAKYTLSCAHTHLQPGAHPHCGTCSQCIDRKFGFIAAGMEQHDDAQGYEVQIATQELTNDADRRLVLDWVAAADSFAACASARDFTEEFGEASRATQGLMRMRALSADDAVAQMYAMHRRHGRGIAAALAAINAAHTDRIRTGRLGPNSLLMLLYQQGLEKRTTSPTGLPATGGNQFRRKNGTWQVRFRDGAVVELAGLKGLEWISYLLRSPRRVFTVEGLLALSQHQDPSDHTCLDALGKAEVMVLIKHLENERADAVEFSDAESATRYQSEITELRALSEQNGDAVVEDDAVRLLGDEIRTAIAAVERRCAPLGAHLRECLHVGHVFWYRGSVVPWMTDDHGVLPTAPRSRPQKGGKQLFGWPPILKALGLDNTRANKDLVKNTNADLGGPIKPRGVRGVVANELQVQTWWQSVADRAAVAAKKQRLSKGAAQTAKTTLDNPHEARALGMQTKERVNTRRRKRE